MPIVNSEVFGVSLCKAMGLDPKTVQEITIHVRAHGPVIADVVMLPGPEAVEFILASAPNYKEMGETNVENHR